MRFTKLLSPRRRALPTVNEAGDDKQLLAVGCYSIGMAVPEDLKMPWLYQKEYPNADSGVDAQKLHYLLPVIFLGFPWMVILAVVDNTVISLKATTLTENITETMQAITLVQQCYSERLGVPEERKPENAFCLWRNNNAQVTYQVSPFWPFRHNICISGLRPRS